MKIIFIFISIVIFCCFCKVNSFDYNPVIVGLYFFTGAFLILYFVRSAYFIVNYVYYVFLSLLAYQDLKTYYLSWYWYIASVILMFICGFDYHFISGILFLFPALSIRAFSKDWIGSADLFYLFYFGLILGYERMLIALIMAIITGFLFAFLSKKKIIPFISCLAIGVIIAMLRGYSIYLFFYDILYL